MDIALKLTIKCSELACTSNTELVLTHISKGIMHVAGSFLQAFQHNSFVNLT